LLQLSARDRVPDAIMEIARSAVEAFLEKHGTGRAIGWCDTNVEAMAVRTLSPTSYRAKRRRLLVDITKMQDAQTVVAGPDGAAPMEQNDAEFVQLCTAARVRIDAWLREGGS